MRSKPRPCIFSSLSSFFKQPLKVIGSLILGVLLLSSFIIPFLNPSSSGDASSAFLKPKWFPINSLGFLDGSEKEVGVPLSNGERLVYKDSKLDTLTPLGFNNDCVIGSKEITESRADEVLPYGFGGYLELTPNGAIEGELVSPVVNFQSGASYSLSVTLESSTNSRAPSYGLYLYKETEEILLGDYFSSSKGGTIYNLEQYFPSGCSLDNWGLSIHYQGTTPLCLKSLLLNSTLEMDPSLNLSFLDADHMLLGNSPYECKNSTMQIKEVHYYEASFRYDKYEAVFGLHKQLINSEQILQYCQQNLCSFSDYSDITTFQVIDERCPIKQVYQRVERGSSLAYECEVCGYLYYGYSSSPSFVLGTNKEGTSLTKTLSLAFLVSLVFVFLLGGIYFLLTRLFMKDLSKVAFLVLSSISGLYSLVSLKDGLVTFISASFLLLLTLGILYPSLNKSFNVGLKVLGPLFLVTSIEREMGCGGIPYFTGLGFADWTYLPLGATYPFLVASLLIPYLLMIMGWLLLNKTPTDLLSKSFSLSN